MVRTLVISLLLLANAATAQSAVVSIVDAPCTSPLGTPMMGHAGLPQIGSTFELTYSGPNYRTSFITQDSVHPVLVIGFSVVGPATIPQGLLPQQPANCLLTPSHDIVIPMPPDPFTSHGPYLSSQTVVIPNNRLMIGIVFMAQWLAVHEQCGPAGCPIDWIATSETAICSVGT